MFLIQAGYHLDDALATREVLAERGRAAAFVTPDPPRDVLAPVRSSTARHREIVARAAPVGLSLGEPIDAHAIVERASVLVVRNDWGPSRALVELARGAGVPTIGWVEGVQDFDDADTGRARRAYGSVDQVFTLGHYDAGILGARASVEVVGSERLWQRWRSEATTAELELLANVNFTYGVNRSDRGAWVDGVIAAARASGLGLRISRHPADRGRRGRRLEVGGGTDVLLPRTARLVSRFSTAVYDALALGVEVVYHNPHGERVPTFADPIGAFTVTTSYDELVEALIRPFDGPHAVRQRASEFLHHHLMLEGPRPAERAAQLLLERGRAI